MFSNVPKKESDAWYTIPQVRARKSSIHGLGLFATDTIDRSTMIERSPLIICDRYTYKCIDDIMGYRHILSDYPYKWNRQESAFALGYSSLINHNHDDPNVLFKFNYDMPAIEFYAKRTIKAGEELTMQYVPEYALDKLWFETDKRFDNTTQITPPHHIGFTCGSFDLMHAGHILMFKEAKSVCEYLIVGVQEDPSLDRDNKNEPIQSYEERVEMVTSCKYVNEIVLYKSENDLYGLLKDIKPDIRIIGDDWRGKNFTGYDLDIEVYYNNREHSYSTSELRNRVFLAESKKAKK
jgi:glycerol-3-phosphate cytidylyltransferase